MRYGFTRGGIQYVLGVLCSPADCAEPYEKFFGRGRRSASRHADFGGSSPGSWQLISAYVLRQEVNAWYLALIGWIGTLLVGSQMIKLIIKGIELIYGDHATHSFLGRQIRGLLLFSFASVAWLVAVALSVFGRPLEQWIASEFGNSSLVRNFLIVTLPVLAMILAMFVLALIYRVERPVTTTWRSVLPGAAAATILWWGVNSLFGIYVRKIQFGPVYGGLAAAIGLMAWMEISAMLVFVGAAWNSENAIRTITLAESHF